MDIEKSLMDNYFKNRATIRRYKPEAPSEEMIENLLGAAMRAPTTGTMQLYSVVSTRQPERLKALAELHFNQPAAASAPLMLTFCADFHRFSEWCRINNAEPGYDNFLSFLSATLDATILTQQFVTLAEMSGLGTCYLGTCIYNAEKIANLLNLPPLTFPIACISVGYPDEMPQPTERLNVEGVLYKESYPDFCKQDIQEIYLPKDSFPANKKFIAENNKESLAQVFTDIRYPKDLNESVSEALLSFLKKQNFLK